MDPYQLVTVTLSDIIFIILIYIFAVIYGKRITAKKIKQEKYYKHFTRGLIIKISFAIIFCTVYMTAYLGDTLDYFVGICAMSNLFWESPAKYFEILFSSPRPEFLYYFSSQTGYPEYHMFIDSNTFFVNRFFSPLGIITGNSFLLSSIIVSVASYTGIWKLYTVFVKKFPEIQDKLAVAVLYFPSVLFWGSGILKDTIVIMALGWLVYSVDNIFVFKRFFKTGIIIILSVWIMIIVKAYVIVVFLPVALIWLFYDRVKQIKFAILRYFFFPFVMLLTFFMFSFIFSQLKGTLGEFGDVDSIIKKAKITQDDLIREEAYGKNYFNIGEIGDTPGSVIKLAPAAIIAGLYRPFIWEAGNIFILISSLENLVLLYLTLLIFIRYKIIFPIRIIGSNPFILGLIIFSVFMAFGIGLSTANFGALVRYRIPITPVFLSCLFAVEYFCKIKKLSAVKKHEEIIGAGSDYDTLSLRVT